MIGILRRIFVYQEAISRDVVRNRKIILQKSRMEYNVYYKELNACPINSLLSKMTQIEDNI